MVEILVMIRVDVSADGTWVEESIHSTNLQLADMDVHVVSYFP